MSTDRKSSRYGIVLIAAFVLLIIIPALGTLFKWDFYPFIGENRILATLPAQGTPLKDLPEQFERYYRDHFGFRNTLLKLHRKIHREQSSLVHIGTGNWMFLESTVQDYLGLRPLPEHEMARIANKMETQRAWLTERNIPYVLVVPPDKVEIYPEKLEIALPKEKTYSTRYDTLKDYLQTHTKIDLLDLKPALLKAKQNHTVYFSNDTHWNCYGAYAAYCAIVEHLQACNPNRQPYALEACSSASSIRKGDLSLLLGRPDDFPVTFDLLTPKNKSMLKSEPYRPSQPQSWHLWPTNTTYGTQIIHNPDAEGCLLVFHDSFTNPLKDLLAGNFATSVFFWMYPTQEALEALTKEFKPDMVMEIHLQRRLNITEGCPLKE